ncbi:3-dehydroquinate synthase [Alicyclobacillus sp. SO9]|uniref:3-dehydroquinate synthase n=1 Tax=Alicyclobacillus sp. SO9 TaxID=2665646 RepID=UPI0018E861B2|nr:3-dehydroquinate synthase [Alicyclobacillus sp. SO9]QQE76801.1 3-dehydroquinate synthase [Alicyclobacillus sp. SO9]
MTTQLTVHSHSHSYPVVIGAGLRRNAGGWLRDLGVSKDAVVMVVTDTTVVSNGYLEPVLASCRAEGFAVHAHSIFPGDASKSLQTTEELYNVLLDAGLRRNGIIIALGGGVVGDLTGFVASTFLRGIPFVQMPTTLLAHDSSIGGKVGVNLERGKNLVGAFYPPLAVLYDTETLQTLPEAQWRAGMAEVIKHGIIGDPSLFERLEALPYASIPSASEVESLLSSAINVKRAVIEQDEQEKNLRMVLNIGHTVGHAIEQYSNYGLTHGEAVSIGLTIESRIAVNRGMLSTENFTRIRQTLMNHGLAVQAPNYPFDALAAILNFDKKHSSSGSWTFVLPEDIGKVTIVQDVAYGEVERSYMEMLKQEASE